MTAKAYYNENDPYAAQWLRNLIDNGHIAPGDVDERSIVDVGADDIKGYRQCHFFAGIGVWSFALRCAGWPDDRPVWTGSCPCQPFSGAGKRLGADDPRHLFPVWLDLIEQCRPDTIFGEQVESKDGRAWLDNVQTDLEKCSYAVGAVAFPAAGIGAPHWRHRIYFVAHAISRRRSRDWREEGRAAVQRGAVGELADRNGQSRNEGCEIRAGRNHGSSQIEGAGSCGGGVAGELAHTDGGNTDAERQQRSGEHRQQPENTGACYGDSRSGPLNGLWANADWLRCTDGKWRPVEPGSFPLAHGVAGRVGRLRAYGNAIIAPQAQAFIEAYLDR